MATQTERNKFAKILNDKHSNNNLRFKHKLKQSQNNIIQILGGMDHILQICLKNNDEEYCVNSDKLQSLKSLLFDSSHSKLTLQRENKKIHHVLYIDPTNNLYFKLFKKEIATKIYKIVSSKYYAMVGALLFFIGFFSVMFPSDIISVYETLFILYLFGPLFAFNIDIMFETVRTFDFWFKLSQLIIFISATIICWNFDLSFMEMSLNAITLGMIWYFLNYVLIFFIDAWNIRFIFKMVLLFLGSLIGCWSFIMVYIYQSDVELNPFENDYMKNTNISIKSVLLSALANITLYNAKPLISGLTAHYYYRDIQKQNFLTESTGIVDRPFFRWLNIDGISNNKNDEIEHIINHINHNNHNENAENDEDKIEFTTLTN